MQSPRRGQIYIWKHDEVEKSRPVVIVSRKELNGGEKVVTVPITSQQIDKRREMKNCVVLEAGVGGVSRRSVVKCGDVTLLRISALDMKRGKIGELDADHLKLVDAALAWSLGLD